MMKLDKSILIVCTISLFLLIGQAVAADSDSLELKNFNAASDSLEIGNQNANSDSLDYEDIDASESGFNTDENNEGPSIDDEISENIYIEDESDDARSHLIEEKETEGIVMAGDDYSCGPASLATALNKMGLNLTLSQVSKHTNTSVNGTSMQSLIDAAKYYNFSAVGIEIDTESLKENYIVHLNINGNEHWTVINKVTDTHVFLADSTGGNMNFTLDEFNSCFTKKAILISNDSQIHLNNAMIQSQIKVIDRNQALRISGKGMKRKVIGYKIVWKHGLIAKKGWVLKPKVVGGHVSFSQWQYVYGTYYVWGKYKAKEPIYKYYYVADDALTSAKIKKSKK